jgi:hypothetical protein
MPLPAKDVWAPLALCDAEKTIRDALDVPGDDDKHGAFVAAVGRMKERIRDPCLGRRLHAEDGWALGQGNP